MRLIPMMLLPAAVLAMSACARQTPQEQQAEQIRDQADAQADAIEAAANDRASKMEADAATLLNQAGTSQSFDAQRLQVQADALEKQAELIEDQADAQAEAVRAAGEAKATALLAQ